MIGILIGVGAILLGAKGFTREGLPLTSKKRLTGTGAIVVGVICVLIGLAFIAEGMFSVYMLSQRRS